MNYRGLTVTEILQYRRGEATGDRYVQVRMESWHTPFWVRMSEIVLDTNA